MASEELKNKPLIEAIFEMRWQLSRGGRDNDDLVDPHYKILVGRFYDRVHEQYPYHEQLPISTMPDELVPHMVQHQFRVTKGGWPLLQIGPGVITVNDTENYIWSDFKRRIDFAVKVLCDIYPDADKNLKVQHLKLRYIDSIDFDFDKDDIFNFMAKKMQTQIQLCPKLFDGTGVKNIPDALDLRLSYSMEKPPAKMSLRFFRGKVNKRDALLWETIVDSLPTDTAQKSSDISGWIEGAHDWTHDWFFKLIEGDLQRRFE